MALQYILDGYNVINCMEMMTGCSLEEGRKRLLKVLAQDRPQGSPRNQVMVVFDGKDGVWGQPTSHAAKIIFSSGETADDRIKRIVDQSHDVKNIVVVTNDGEIVCYVRKLGAKVLSVEEFMSSGKALPKKSRGKTVRSQGVASHKRITRVTEGKINKEMEDIWINKKGS